MTRAAPAGTPGACCCRCGSTAATAPCGCPGKPRNPSSGSAWPWTTGPPPASSPSTPWWTRTKAASATSWPSAPMCRSCWRRASATPSGSTSRTWPAPPKPASSRSARSSPKARRTTAATGPRATSSWPASPGCSRPSAGTSSSWPRPPPAPTWPASRRRASSGSGYDGHYFWDQEVYLLPYLTYTNPAQRPPGARIPPRDAARGQDPRQGAQRGRRPVPVADHQRAGGQRLLRGRHRTVPHRRRDRLRHQPLHLGQRGQRLPADPGRRTADRDRPDVGVAGLLRQGRAVPHPRRHRPRRVHRRRQRQPVHQRHGTLQPARRGGAGPRGDRRRRTRALGAGRATGCSCPTTRTSRCIPRTTTS